MLIINESLNLSLLTVFYFSTKYLIVLGKVADQGPHTNCASHPLTFPPPIDLTAGETTTTIMSSSSTHWVANKWQSLIDKGFAKSCRQIYEIIGFLYKIWRIASLWYLFYSIFITNFAHTRSKASLIVRIWTSGSGYVLQKSVNGLWLVSLPRS